MRTFIVASVLAVMLALFVATVTDVSHDAAETQTVLTVAECPCGLSDCAHVALADYEPDFVGAREAGAVLKLPSEGAVSYTKHEFISAFPREGVEHQTKRESVGTLYGPEVQYKYDLQVPHYNVADEIMAARSRGPLSVGVL